MRRLVARAPGKVNLCLFVGRPRPDGLHPLVSIVQPVSLADELTLVEATRDEVICPALEGENLAARALAAFRAATGWQEPPVRLTITKHVPVAAGMGGGSADAAAALRLLAAASGHAIPQELAMTLGADVPAQVEPRRALVTSAGERVETFPGRGPAALVVVPLDAALSTVAVYRAFDELELGRAPAELTALEDAVRAAPDEHARNDLQAAALHLCPVIEPALAAVAGEGARAMVSGSGPTVFGVLPAPAAAERAAAALRAAGLSRAVAAAAVGPEFAAVLRA